MRGSAKLKSSYSVSSEATTDSESSSRIKASPFPKFEPFPRFPKLDDLVDPKTFRLSTPEDPSPPTRPQGLFEVVLQNHIDILAADAEESGEKYNPQALPLIRDVAEGKKTLQSLSEPERTLLDQATLDFATYVPPKQEQPRPVLKPRVESAPAEEDADPTPGVDVPITEARAYWWVR